MTTAEKLAQINNEIDWYMKKRPYAKLCYEAWPAKAKRHYGWLRWRQKKEEEKLIEKEEE